MALIRSSSSFEQDFKGPEEENSHATLGAYPYSRAMCYHVPYQLNKLHMNCQGDDVFQVEDMTK